MKKCVVFLVCTLVTISSISADVFVKGIQKNIYPRWDGSGNDTSYYEVQTGTVTLKTISIEGKPHGSYLEVTENAQLSLYNIQTGLEKIWVSGIFVLPSNSSIASFSLYTDSSVYPGVIFPVYKKNNPIDTISVKPKATLKFSHHDNNNFDYYELKIDSVIPGNDYNIKIRYLIPNNGGPAVSYKVSVLCNTQNTPGTIEFSFNKDPKEKNYLLKTGTMKFQLSGKQSVQIPYQASFEVVSLDSSSSVFHVTDFQDGTWKGKYLLLNTQIPDSVMSKLCKSIELVVLWRWNNPKSFTIKNSYSDYKYVSAYGYQSLSQAEAIKSLMNDCASTGNKTGLVHSIAHKKPEIFKLSNKNSAVFGSMMDYLNTFTYDYLINSEYFDTDFSYGPPSDTLKDSSKVEFLKSMNIVHGLYSNGAGIMKHLVIVSCGPVRVSRNLVTLEEIDSLVNGMSVDCNNAQWTDANLPLVKSVSVQRPLVQMNGSFLMPTYKPSSILLNVASSDKVYSFPLSSDCQSFSITAKSQNAWNPQLSWIGYDADGMVMNTVTSTASVYTGVLDTGLVKLWAVNSSRLNDHEESDIALEYGVVTEETVLKMYPAMSRPDSGVFALVDKRYQVDLTGRTATRKLANTRFSCTISNGMLKIMCPIGKSINTIKVYTLSGKLLAELDPSNYIQSGEYLVPKDLLLKNRTISQMVIVRIEGTNLVNNFQLFM
jgi:hypothetical protein